MLESLHAPVKRKRKRIALLVNFLNSAYQVSFRAAIERAVHAQGANFIAIVGREVEHADANEGALNVVYDWLTPESVDGVLMLSSTLANYGGTDGIARLRQRLARVPVASVGIVVPDVPSIVLDNKAAMRVAVEHLLRQHGLKRVAYISGPKHNQEAVARLQGYREALELHGIGYDPALVEEARFTLSSGQAAMDLILSRAPCPDGVVAANDYMAIGAMDALRDRGFKIPEDVLVVGFDDAPVARFAARSLTTVAQPIDAMAQRIVHDLMGLMDGIEPAPVSTLGVSLTLRESCGCGYVVRRAAESSRVFHGTTTEYLDSNRSSLIAYLLASAGASRAFWSTFVERLVDALVADLRGNDGCFLRCVEQIGDETLVRDESLDEVGRAIVQLRRECRRAGLHGAAHADFEEVAMKAFAILAVSATRREGRRALDLVDRAYGLRHVNQQLSLALDDGSLARSFVSVLPNMGIQFGLLATLAAEGGRLSPLVALQNGADTLVATAAYPCRQLLPAGFPNDDVPWSLTAFPLTFETEVLGLVAFDGATDAFACESLRAQISAAIKLGTLHQRVVEETALRERLAHQQLLGEMAIAKRIQTALTPREPSVLGLELGAGMLPADQVGGDYYDIIPVAGGAWFGVGDVTGHGLLSGLIMLMVQSIVSTLVKQQPNAQPAELVTAVNSVVRPNIRERLGQNEHMTFMLLRYFDDGRLVFAGAHEELLHYRASTGRCEGISCDGMWIGILDDIGPLTHDFELRLEPGDLALLITDGLIEARDARGEQFGIERVRELVERNAALPAAELCQKLVSASLNWARAQQDDITCVVIRKL